MYQGMSRKRSSSGRRIYNKNSPSKYETYFIDTLSPLSNNLLRT